MKKKACVQVGLLDRSPPPLPATVTQEQVLAIVAALNADPKVHGILVQLPLPPHIDEQVRSRQSHEALFLLGSL